MYLRRPKFGIITFVPFFDFRPMQPTNVPQLQIIRKDEDTYRSATLNASDEP